MEIAWSHHHTSIQVESQGLESLATSVKGVWQEFDDDGTALSDVVMDSGVHRAEFRIEYATPDEDMAIGVAEHDYDTRREECASDSACGWGWINHNGLVYHTPGYNTTREDWPGRETWATGDHLQLELDCEAGTLQAFKAGRLLGTLVQGLQGKKLRWSCEFNTPGQSIGIQDVGIRGYLSAHMLNSDIERVAQAYSGGGGAGGAGSLGD